MRRFPNASLQFGSCRVPSGQGWKQKQNLHCTFHFQRQEKKEKGKKQKTCFVGHRPSPSAGLIGVAARRAQTLIPLARLEASLINKSLSQKSRCRGASADWTDDTEAPAGAERGPLAEVTAGVTDDEHLQPGHKFNGEPRGAALSRC